MRLAEKYLSMFEEALPVPEGKAAAGFDLTSFGDGKEGADKFKKLLKAFGISEKPAPHYSEFKGKKDQIGWEWKGKDLLIVTGNDPISGKYGQPNRRDDEVGYASYIGLEGSKESVKKAFSMVKELTDNIKDENPTEREYI